MEPYPPKYETKAYIARHLQDATQSAQELMSKYGEDFNAFFYRPDLAKRIKQEIIPGRIENNSLIFENKGREGCDTAIVTRLSFANGIPRQFFLECKNKTGDIYQFGTE